MYLTPDSIDPATVLRLIMVSQDLDILGAVTDAIDSLADKRNWQKHGVVTPEEIAAYMFGVAANEREMSLIGLVFPYATVLPPSFALPCDGAVLNRVDYPRLYDALDASFIIDADTFVVPDLRDRVIVGEGTVHGIAETGGEDTHTLITSEMPSHTHVDSGHSHTDGIAAPTLIAVGAGVPAPSAVPSVGVTGLGNANLSSVGNDFAHNNMQPFQVLRYCIVFQ